MQIQQLNADGINDYGIERTHHFSYKISLLILAQFFHPNSFQLVICVHPSFPGHTKIGTHILRVECFIPLSIVRVWSPPTRVRTSVARPSGDDGRVYVLMWFFFPLHEKWKWKEEVCCVIEVNHEFNFASYFFVLAGPFEWWHWLIPGTRTAPTKRKKNMGHFHWRPDSYSELCPQRGCTDQVSGG